MRKNTIFEEVDVLHLFEISDEKETADRHVITNIQRILRPRSILNRNDQKHKHIHTQRHCHDQLSADENKPCTARTSIHPTQEGRWQHTWTAHVQLSNDATASTLTRVESLNMKADRHVCGYKNMSNGSIYFVICTFKGNSGGDSQLIVVFCHKMNVWARKIVTCSWDGLYDKNLSWNPVSILAKWSCSRAQPWSWKDFVSKLGLDGTPRSAWECRRQGKHWWMFVAWHSYRRLWHMQNFHWSHELTAYTVLTLAISASELQVVFIFWNINV